MIKNNFQQLYKLKERKIFLPSTKTNFENENVEITNKL